MTQIKICGIQTIYHALATARAGADYIGFVFAKSKRQVCESQAKAIIEALPKSVKTVGVFVNTPLDEMERIADYCGLDLLQLHGSEDYETYHESKYPVIKSVSIKDESNQESMLLPKADYLLFDTWHKDMAGGCGQSFEWSTLKSLPIKKPYFLAGGLTVDNVEDAVKYYQPFAVDISSGVETDGIKDINKIQTFIQRVKEANNDL